MIIHKLEVRVFSQSVNLHFHLGISDVGSAFGYVELRLIGPGVSGWQVDLRLSGWASAPHRDKRRVLDQLSL